MVDHSEFFVLSYATVGSQRPQSYFLLGPAMGLEGFKQLCDRLFNETLSELTTDYESAQKWLDPNSGTAGFYVYPGQVIDQVLSRLLTEFDFVRPSLKHLTYSFGPASVDRRDLESFDVSGSNRWVGSLLFEEKHE